MQQLPPLTLGPHYRALSLLAKGGMGAVYLGQAFPRDEGDTTTVPQLVAIKVMHGHIADSPDAIAMFIDEARIGTRIEQPNVVRVLDTDVGDDTPFIVMEYIEGLSLARLLQRFVECEESPPIDIVTRVVHDALLGLGAAHALDAVHRDVSPHNILVGVDGHARITDFGVATFTGRIAKTAPGGVRGKFGYMAPEQLSHGGVDGRADVFSAGIVLWEGLTGRELFQCESEAETLAKVLRDPIPPPSSFAFDVTADLEDVCLKALERDIERRFDGAHEFATALAAAVPLASPERVAEAVCRLGADALSRQRHAREAAAIEVRRPRPQQSGMASTTVRVEAPAPARRGVLVIAAAMTLLLLGTFIGRASSRDVGPTTMAGPEPPSLAPAAVRGDRASSSSPSPTVMSEVPSNAQPPVAPDTLRPPPIVLSSGVHVTAAPAKSQVKRALPIRGHAVSSVAPNAPNGSPVAAPPNPNQPRPKPDDTHAFVPGEL